MAHEVLVGTSGWSYDDWVGPFYPPRTPKSDYLSFYAEQFRIVEVDSTYYRPPSRRMVQGWNERTPEHFRFALKMPGEITHEKVLAGCEEAMEALLDALEPLRTKILCVLLQFGYFNRQAFASAGPFMERLAAFCEKYADRIPLACEIRNKAWLNEAYFGLLRRYGVSAALVEHAWLPPIEQLIERHDVATGPFSYLRLIGDRSEIERTTKSWEKVVVDRSADLARVALAIRRIAERVPVVTFVNNHYAGHGPQTARELEARLVGS